MPDNNLIGWYSARPYTHSQYSDCIFWTVDFILHLFREAWISSFTSHIIGSTHPPGVRFSFDSVILFQEGLMKLSCLSLSIFLYLDYPFEDLVFLLGNLTKRRQFSLVQWLYAEKNSIPLNDILFLLVWLDQTNFSIAKLLMALRKTVFPKMDLIQSDLFVCYDAKVDY